MRLHRSPVITAVVSLALLMLESHAASIQTSPVDGFWITDGYGYLIKINAATLETYELTSVSCMKRWSATRKPARSRGAEVAFVGKDGDTLRLLPGPSDDVRLFQEDGAASCILARRVADPPAIFSARVVDTPQANFDIFWKTFDEHYPFFAMKGIDWAAVGEKHRREVQSATTPQELFGILRAMIQPLYDAHTFIAARDIKKHFFGWRPDTPRLAEQEVKRTVEIISTKYVRSPMRAFCNGHLSFGMLSFIGYLRVDGFEDYAKQADYLASVESLESALDVIFHAKLRGLVVDVRMNDGGADPLGIAISSRLTERDYLAYTKQARIDPHNPAMWSPGQDSIVHASNKPHFYGPVALLIGPRTVSAGETFAMSLMGRASPVLRIGENTQGVFSDLLERKLPNGWNFGLPNERYLTKEGRSFDGRGVPPDVAVAVFPQTDLRSGRDGALERAVELLNKR